MNITEERSGGFLVLRLRQARLDASTAPALRKALVDRIMQGEQALVLDLRDVTFMDSSALGALISAVKMLGPTGTIAVASMTGPVAKLFSMTKMDRVFSVNATVDDAVKVLGS